LARRSLRPHLNQIRSWVRQGRTDAWIAHQLEVTVQQIQSFKREQGLEEGDVEASNGAEFEDEIDLRAEDDALIAAELDAAEKARAEEAESESDGDSDDDEEEQKPKRRRGRRGGRRRSGTGSTGPLEGSFDHGEEGYGLWLDPGVVDNPVYAEHWAGHRPVEVTIEEDRIVIRRAGAESSDDDEE
jgi:hypothetical protein